jgi:hypothetical protein
MTFPKTAKPEAIASADKLRRSICEPYLDIETLPATEDTVTCDGLKVPGVSVRVGRLVSTDGKAMAILPVDIDDHDVSGYVSGAALSAARKQAGKLDQAKVGLNGKAELPDGSTMPRNGGADGTYPNWRLVKDMTKGEPVFRYCVNVELLLRLAKAIGSDGPLMLEFYADENGKPDNLAPATVKWAGAGNPTGGKGIIMPMRFE